MNRIIFYASSLVFGLFIQLFVGRYITLFGVGPDLLFVYVLAVAFYQGPLTGEVLGFTLGLVADVLGARLFGLQSFLFTLSGYIAGLLRRRVDSERPVSQAVIAFVGTFLYGIGGAFVKLILAQSGPRTPLTNFFIEGIMNAMFAPFVFWAALWWIQVWRLHHE